MAALEARHAEATLGGDKILIRDLLARGIIGVNAHEREKPQDILINVELFTDLRLAGETDDPAAIINYRSVTKDILTYVDSSSHLLVEALATAIARICVVGHGAQRAVVRVEKPGALRFAKSGGVEIDRSRDDFVP